jgi:hypothetical protein
MLEQELCEVHKYRGYPSIGDVSERKPGSTATTRFKIRLSIYSGHLSSAENTKWTSHSLRMGVNGAGGYAGYEVQAQFPLRPIACRLAARPTSQPLCPMSLSEWTA